MPKLIREGRFGPPGSFKTGATVGTYPRPLLVLCLDNEGLSIIKEPIRKISLPAVGEGFDIKPFAEVLSKPMAEQAPITAIDLSGYNKMNLDEAYTPQKNKATFKAVITAVNELIKQPLIEGETKLACPFKTIVFDNATRLNEAIMGHQSALNPAAMVDARKWAPNISMKVQEIIQAIQRMNSHVVVLMHSDDRQDELTKTIETLPMIYATFRQLIAGVFTQFFYSIVEPGTPPKAFVLTQGQGLVKEIRCNWPSGLPIKCGALFNDIYGKEQGLL